jgi:hypothetical protein
MSSENVANVKHLGTAETNHILIHEKIKNTRILAMLATLQFRSTRLLALNIKMKIYRILISSVV